MTGEQLLKKLQKLTEDELKLDVYFEATKEMEDGDRESIDFIDVKTNVIEIY